MTAIEPGTEIAGFVVEAVAGRGGMGVVYRARQLRPERLVALKVISPELAHDPGFQARFERESEIAAQIEHPNVIPVYAVGEASGVLYIAMRFVTGTDLREILRQEGALDPGRATALVDQVAQALDAAHARGLVHRDVKPSNVLVATSGGREHAYLTDFGLSRLIDSSHGVTGTGALVGTIDYVAPEQARGQSVDARTDVYSLGCMLFHLLTGTVPYPRPNEVAKIYAHTAEPPPPVTERAPRLPAAFDAVLSRAMAKDPADRFPSAGDLGRAALAAAGGRSAKAPEQSVATGVAAPPAPAATRVAVPPERRRRWPLVAAAAAALIAVVVAGLLLLGGGDDGGGSGQTAGSGIAPAGHRALESQQVKSGAVRYRVGLSVPEETSKSSAEAVPATMSLLARERSEPERVVQRKELPAPPYTFAGNSYVSEFQLAPAEGDAASLDLSWYVHPGAGTRTCYFSLSLGGIQLDGCG
jgi:hypothetical protein